MLGSLKSLTALVVEDEEEIAQNLRELLGYFFADVLVASDGLEALELLKKVYIHALFIDYEMPNLNGYELVKEMRDKSFNIPVTMISNHDDREILQSCIPLGLFGYIFKPLKYDELKAYLVNFSEELVEKGVFKYRFSGECFIDFSTNTLYIEDKSFLLTKLEVAFLRYMVNLKGRVGTFEQIYDALYEFELSQNSIKDLVYRLKNKYGFDRIKNIKSVGYTIVNPD